MINIDDAINSDQNLRLMQYQEIVLKQYNNQHEIETALLKIVESYNKLKIENEELLKRIAEYEDNGKLCMVANEYLKQQKGGMQLISYREKELLMVMKMLQDETEKNISNIQNVMDSVNKRENIKTEKLELNIEKIEEYDQLVEMARDKGYDLYMRAEDILSQEEIQDLIKRKESIEQEFKQKVKLKRCRLWILFSAVALQIAKQIFLTIDIETGDKKAKETEKEYKEKYDNKNKIDGKQKAKKILCSNTADIKY